MFACPSQAWGVLTSAQMSNSDRLPTAAIRPTSVEVNPPHDALGNMETNPPASETTEPPNALGVLYSALPSDVASSIASELEIDAVQFLPYERASKTTLSATRLPESCSTSTFSSHSSSTSLARTTAASTFSTITRASSITSASASSTSTAAKVTDSATQLRQGSIAGIITGVTAGLVLIVLAVLLLLRRKKQAKAVFSSPSRSSSQRSNRVYPEIALLYDRAPTPPRTSESHRRGESGSALLLPTAYEGAAGIAGAQQPHESPDMRAADADSPLLPPQALYARDDSPGSPGGSSPRSGRVRSPRSSLQSVAPMGAIYEEPHVRS